MALSKRPSSETIGRPSFWTPGRIGLTLAGVVLISALASSSCNSNDVATNNAPANRAVNAPPANAPPPVAPPTLSQTLRDTKLQTLDGGSLKLSDFADKVVVLNLWATWCGPCRLEMPELIKISNEYKSRGLVVIGVATSYNEQNDEGHVKEYIQSQSVPYKIVWDDGTLARPLVEAVQGRGVIPQSFVVARDGRILKHFTGYSAYSTPQLMRQAIEEALNDKGKA